MGAIEGTPGEATTNRTSGSTDAVTVRKVPAGAIIGGSARGLDLGKAVQLGSTKPMNSFDQVQSANVNL